MALKNYQDKKQQFNSSGTALMEALRHDVIMQENISSPEKPNESAIFECISSISNELGSSPFLVDLGELEYYDPSIVEMLVNVQDNNFSVVPEDNLISPSYRKKTDRKETDTQPDCDKKIVNYSDSSDNSDTDELQTMPKAQEECFSNRSPLREHPITNHVNSEHAELSSNDEESKDSKSSATFSSSSSGNISSASDRENQKGKKRKKKISERLENKKKKNSGESYRNYRNVTIEKKKVLPNPCKGKRCINKCNTFSEEERHDLFSRFWTISNYTEKRNFLNGCINVVPVKRRRTEGNSRRNLTYQYYFLKVGVQKRVCLQFFLNTLNITQKMVRSSIQGKIEENIDNRGKHEPNHKISPKQIEEFKCFIENMPTVPSHYSRGSTSKLYLPAEIKSVSNLYRIYCSKMEETNSVPLKLSTFKKHFRKDYNIGIHVPKKDKCSFCVRFENIPESERTGNDKINFLSHQQNNTDAKQVFLSGQNMSLKNGFLVASFDLQKVLATPHGPSMLFGFSRKYSVYNFTIYESKSQNGFCYIWGESDGKRGVNEISSNLNHYLTKLDHEEQFKSISFFCDNCPGQNKNKTIFSMILHFLHNSKTIEEISITYLVAGHTYMPVDSVHAVIERKIKNMNIQAPSEWPTIIRNARLRPKPYETIQRYYSDFRDWKSLAVPKKIKSVDGSDIKISSITRATFKKNDPNKKFSLFTNYNFNSPHGVEWSGRFHDIVPMAYNGELPLNKKKIKNLLDLCRTLKIKKQYHGEYYTLKAGNNIPDELPETDEEDNVE